jgi:hypothetical protein
MSRAYRNLAIAVMLAALLVAVLARHPQRVTTQPSRTAIAQSVQIALQIRHGAVTPDPTHVPKGRLVELTIVNHEPGPVRLTLAGYEDRVDTQAIASGATWSGSFLADRPGQEFAWLIGGRPAGLFAVTGSHLEEGHQ